MASAGATITRYRPLLLLVGSLAAAAVLLALFLFSPKVRAIQQLREAAAERQSRVSESLRQWSEMSEKRDERASAWEEALARAARRVPHGPELEGFMAELSALAVRHHLRAFRLTPSGAMGGAAGGPDQGPAPVASAPEPQDGLTPGGADAGASSAAGESPPTELRYRVLFTSTYSDLADLLDDLPRMRRLVTVRSVKVAMKEGALETALEISIFHRGSP